MGRILRCNRWPDMRCERSTKTRADPAVSAYGHPSRGGAGERKLHRGTRRSGRRLAPNLDQLEPEPLDPACH